MSLYRVKIEKKVQKIIKSKKQSSKDKYNSIIPEVRDSGVGGEWYKKLSGEHLFKLDHDGLEIHSVEIEPRLRLVFEVPTEDDLLVFTDLANHEYRGNAYAKQYSEEN